MAIQYNNILACIGNTPLAEFTSFAKAEALPGHLLAKLEFANPFGSIKDRVALAMIESAETDGRLQPGGVVIEPTSGNTGIGIAGVASVKGYRVILTMPDTMSVERRQLLAAHGAELVLTEGKLGMNGAIAEAKRLAEELGDAFIPGQFDNPANLEAHYSHTGPELWRDAGHVDVFVAGVGTGGTLSGVGKYLREQNRDVKIVAVEPADSPVLSGGKPGPHGIQGIGAGFVPAILDTTVYDEIIQVATDDAKAAARAVAGSEGVLIGISGGANVWAAAQIILRPEFAGKTVATVIPDSGERYMSLGLFD